MASAPNLLAFRRSDFSGRTPDVLLGPSPAIAHVWSQIRRVAPYFRTALITGERGTGADAVAHVLHSLSPLAARPFTLIGAAEAEARFTATTLPRYAGDTLFFPEIEHLSPAAQDGLLRLLRVRRPSQVCIIASATGDLRPLVSAGSFSATLASSLTALHITLPALRERREDIPALGAHFLLREAKALGQPDPVADAAFYEALADAPWPGNIDQLQTVLQKLLQQHSGQSPQATDLQPLLEATQPQTPTAAEPVRLLRLEQVVHEHIRAVLLRCNGNKLRAAEVLGISRSTLYRMLDTQTTPNPFSLAS